jgi:hypothetical protein
MNGLSLAPDGFPTDGRTATTTAAADRNAAGQRRAAADGKAFSEIVSSLSRPPEAPAATGVAADADAPPEATTRPLMRAALTLAPEMTGDGPPASPAVADARQPAGDGDTAPSPWPNGAAAGRRVGAALSALAVGAAPQPGTVTPGTAAKATGPAVGEPQKSIWTELMPQDSPPAELAPRDSASAERTPRDASSTELMPASAGRSPDGADGSTPLPQVPHHGNDWRLTGKATALVAEPGTRPARDAETTTGDGRIDDGRIDDEPALPAPATGAAWPAEVPAAGAASLDAATTIAPPTVAPTTIPPIDAPSAAFVPMAPVAAQPAPGATAPAEQATAMPAAEPAKLPSSGAAAKTTSESGAATAPVSTPAVEPGAVAARPAPFDVMAAATAETTAAAAPAVASLVGRVAVHVREMRTHFAPVTARPAAIAGEPAGLTARAPVADAALPEAAPAGDAALVEAAGASAPSGRASPSDAPSPAGEASSPPDAASPAAGRATVGGAASPVPPTVARAAIANETPVSGTTTTTAAATTTPPAPAPAPGAAPQAASVVAAAPQATAPDAEAGPDAPSDAVSASTAGDRRPAADAARAPVAANADQASRAAEGPSRRAEGATAPLREPRQEARAEIGAETRAEVRQDARTTETTGPASSTTAAGGGSAGDTALRTLAQDIGRAARTMSGEAQPAAPGTGIGSSRPIATRRDVELELRSPDFGVVRLRMRLTGSSLELRLHTNDAATLSLLAERRADLEQAISEFGVDATVVDVGRVSQAPSATTPFSAQGQGPAGDTGRGTDGQRFEQQPSPERNDRRPSSQHHTDGLTSDEDQPARSGPRAGTLFV